MIFMQNIDKIIEQLVENKNININRDELLQKAFSYPEIKQFLQKHQNELTAENLKISQSKIFEYYQQKLHGSMPGYQPKLFIENGVINIKYQPTSEKISNDQKTAAKRRLQLINIAPAYRNVDLKSIEFDEHRANALSEMANFINKYGKEPVKGLYLAGNFGVGKTYILAGLANSLTKNGKNVVFLHVPTFIAGLSSHFEDNSLQSEIEKIEKTDVLILDDIGAETLSPWSRDDVLGVILQYRMDNNLATFFSSNMSMDELQEHFAHTKNTDESVKARRLMERVHFLSKEVIVGGRNRRQNY